MAEYKTFSQKLQRLEDIVALLERPDVELEDGLKLLEEGVALHQQCQKMLSQTQTKINKLLDTSATELTSEAVSTDSDEPQTEMTLFDVEVEASNLDMVKDSDDQDLPF